MNKLMLLVLASMLFAGGCTSPDTAKEALVKSGYSNIATGGYAWYGCGRDDWFHTEFTATNPNGQKVSGIVCSGLLKGSTVRF